MRFYGNGETGKNKQAFCGEDGLRSRKLIDRRRVRRDTSAKLKQIRSIKDCED